MAHNLATINGASAFAYLDASPWHRLGQRLNLKDVPPAERIAAAIQAARMDYTVGSLPLFLADGTSIPDFKASVRFGADGLSVAATLSVVGKGYTHIQNAEACDVLQPLATEFGCVPAAAGVLGQGERCWLLMRLGDTLATPLPGDDVRGYVLAHWGHDGNVSLQLLGTSIRVVCQNTLSMATSGKRAWISIRHTTNAGARLDQAAKLMAQLLATFASTGETFASMAAKNLSAAQLAAYVAAAIPNTTATGPISPVITARRETVSRLVFAGRGAALANQGADTAQGEASLWAAYNGVTEYIDHVRTAEAQSPAGQQRAQESAIFGGNAEIKAQALQLARQLVAA